MQDRILNLRVLASLGLSLRKIQKNHRRASAGAQAEHFPVTMYRHGIASLKTLHGEGLQPYFKICSCNARSDLKNKSARFSVSTALLLNEVSEKKSRNLKRSFRNFLRNLLRNLPRNSPQFFCAFLAVEKFSPKISPDFAHRKFRISNWIPNQFHQKFHKHTSAGLAALILWVFPRQ